MDGMKPPILPVEPENIPAKLRALRQMGVLAIPKKRARKIYEGAI